MKNIIFKSALTCGILLAMAGCSVNSWNDHSLPGFDEDNIPAKPITGSLTLSESDYSAISRNSTNVAIAKENGASNALKNIATDLYFTSEAPARTYLPAWMASTSFPYFLADVGSTVELTYQQALGGTSKYTVSTADYQTVYGSDVDFVEAFAPRHLPTDYIPQFLKAQYADAASGTEVIVNYAYTDEEPNFGEKWEMSDILGTINLNDNVVINGIVTGICGRGFVLTDKGGSILCYQASGYDADAVKLGNKVKVTGKIGSYNKGFQIAITADDYKVMGADEYTYPTPVEVNGADMDEAIKRSSNELGIYVKFTAKASVSGNYYNFLVDGTTQAQGSGYQLNNAQKKAFADGQTYTITGWFLSISNSGGAPKFYNFIPVTVNGKMIQAMAPPSAGVAAEKQVAVYALNGGNWAPASNVTTLTAADYASMGVAENSLTDPEFYLPIFLKSALPYAEAGSTQYVIYNKTSIATALYNGTEWTVNNNGLSTVTTQWKRTADGWSFVKTIGVAVFSIVDGTELTLDRHYLMVSDGICATPLDASKPYGYLYTAPVPSGETLELASDANAFEFVTTYINAGTELTCPEGKFLIKDPNTDRYLYMQGTFNSFNVTETPIVDGAINPSAMFTATANGDGTWKISTTVGNDEKWIQYSTNYGSWGCYANVSGNDPVLYILAD